MSEKKYNIIFPNYEDWPIVQLNEGKDIFHESVKSLALEKIFSKYNDEGEISRIIEKTIESEKKNISRDENATIDLEKFWISIEEKFSGNFGNRNIEREILSIILDFYLESISGNFSIYHYNLAKRGVFYTLSKLLHPMSIPYTDGLLDENVKLSERIKIDGKVDEVRSLITKGIVVLLPTHFSNLDSAVLAWGTNYLGLPPFLYAAGVNLFSNKFWNYTLSRVGTYKIDRAKKNIIYLLTVDIYIIEVVKWGCNTIFYPHGGRSRSGAIEKEIKKGLLSSVISAQDQIFQKEGICGKKIFLVPVTINYPFVLEAPLFGKKCLESFLGDDTALIAEPSQSESFVLYEKFLSITAFTKRFFMEEANISLVFGQPLDIFGNNVNELGKSFNNEQPISVYKEIEKNENNYFKSTEHIKKLTSRIVQEQWRGTVIHPCHLLACAAVFSLENIIRNNEKQDPYNQVESYTINYYEIFDKFKQLHDAAIYIGNNNLGIINKNLFEGEIEIILKKALDELGAYHTVKPLKKNDEGDFVCKDFGILIYYSNRLAHYFHIFKTFLPSFEIN